MSSLLDHITPVFRIPEVFNIHPSEVLFLRTSTRDRIDSLESALATSSAHVTSLVSEIAEKDRKLVELAVDAIPTSGKETSSVKRRKEELRELKEELKRSERRAESLECRLGEVSREKDAMMMMGGEGNVDEEPEQYVPFFLCFRWLRLMPRLADTRLKSLHSNAPSRRPGLYTSKQFKSSRRRRTTISTSSSASLRQALNSNLNSPPPA